MAQQNLSISKEKIQQHLQQVVGERHRKTSQAHLDHVRQYIKEQLLAYGLDPEEHIFAFDGTHGRNIIALKKVHKAEGTWLITAHYDSVTGSPGADDNASAIAALLECARVLSAAETSANILFVAFDMEEDGFAGSNVFVRDKAAEYSIRSVLNMEMVGYRSFEPNSQKIPPGLEQLFPEQVDALRGQQFIGAFIAAVANEQSAKLLQTFFERSKEAVPGLPIVPLVVPQNGEMAPVLRRSDHAPFWDAGYPALMLTDTSEYRNPNYHTSTDTLDTLDVDFIVDVAKAVVACVQ